MSARPFLPPVPSPEVQTSAPDAGDRDGDSERMYAPSTMARAKLRRYVERVGIEAAVRKTGIPRATLLALRVGAREDPKVSTAIVLERHAGIALHDWETLIPACRSSSQK